MTDEKQSDPPLSDQDKQALREQAAQANMVPQFPDELDAKAKEAEQDADPSAQRQSQGRKQTQQ